MATIQIIQLSKQDGKTNKYQWDEFITFWKSLSDGQYELPVSKRINRNYTTRTRYHWGYLLPELIIRCNIRAYDEETGEERLATSDELHFCHKLKYNSVTIIHPLTGKMTTVGMSSTKLSDEKFVNHFEDQILSDYFFKYPENFEGFMDRDSWIDLMKKKHNGIIENSKI